MKANQAFYKVATMCRVLEVSTSGYYAWLKRPLSARAQADVALTERIVKIHKCSDGTYGVPRIYEELVAEGERIGRKRVARLMRAAGLEGVSRRKRHRTTYRDRDGRVAADLVNRDFTANRPDQLWVADITYISTWAGFLYLAVVVDAWSRRVVGWAMAPHLRAELVLEALNMALWQRQPEAVIHHSDQGCQYTSIAFGLRCRKAGVRPSMGSTGGLLRQRVMRELLRHARMRTPGSPKLPHTGRSSDVRISIHRGLVQLPSATLSTRISLSHEL